MVLLKLSLCKRRLSNPTCNGVMKCNTFIRVFLFHSTAPGLFSSTDMLDFGTLRTMGKLYKTAFILLHTNTCISISLLIEPKMTLRSFSGFIFVDVVVQFYHWLKSYFPLF